MSTVHGRRRKTRSSTVRQMVQLPPEELPMTVDLCSLPEDSPSCIDLTDEPDDIVDITVMNDSSVVCLGTVSSPLSTSRRSNRRRSVQAVEPPVILPVPQPVSSTLPDVPSTSSKRKATEDSPNPKKISVSCPICFDTMKMMEESNRQLVSTVCGHLFCSTCLNKAIRTHHACPNCRRKLTLKQYHPIFI